MKKKWCILLLSFLFWVILFICIAKHFGYLGQPEYKNVSIHLLKDVDVFSVSVSPSDFRVQGFGKGEPILFWSIEDDRVLISLNSSYVDIEKSVIELSEKSGTKLLSYSEKVSLLRALARNEDIGLDFVPGCYNPVPDGIEPLYDYIDVSGQYVGRIVLTTEYPSVNKEDTDVDDVLKKEKQNENGSTIRTVIVVLVIAAVLVGVESIFLFEKKTKASS